MKNKPDIIVACNKTDVSADPAFLFAFQKALLLSLFELNDITYEQYQNAVELLAKKYRSR